ncbi:MAG TPA: acyl-CoA ligase (AMP-forming), exosortase A system-associated [Noviherbaspirillum sp.]|nr:acyl-CoA ligase (AMP-forming), exosortase A system-associated [Noviherbaspirillum sp.]
MELSGLIHELIHERASATPDAEALVDQHRRLSYAGLARRVDAMAGAVLTAGLFRSERVAVYLEKRAETVVALFGTSAAGGVFVPVNPLLKAEQVTHILTDCNVRILVTSAERLKLLAPALPRCLDLHTVVYIGHAGDIPSLPGLRVLHWEDFLAAGKPVAPHRCIDSDMAAILYTSGSTGKPKGVVLSHRNLVTGAKSVTQYLENTSEDRILALLPFSFDYGLNQLTTAFCCGATAVLMNYLLPRDVVRIVEEERITGLAAVPPLWIQLAQQAWPEHTSLRYLTNSGGAMPQPVLASLRTALPRASVYLMYGLTEAFRSTYLPPSELDRRPDSIGRAIPNAEIMVVRPDGSLCDVDEPGELVHRGALVSLGYWNDPERTAERFRRVPGADNSLTLPELAVWSGDTVRMDAEGFLYFIGRRDEMIKVSGYRVSPTEVEEVLHATGLVAEAAACGVPHPALGQAIVAAVTPAEGREVTPESLLQECRLRLPGYMVPSHIALRTESLPRNPNGKIDRNVLRNAFNNLFADLATS